MNLLNPALLAALQRRFGRENVEVISPGDRGREVWEPVPAREWQEIQRRAGRRAVMLAKFGFQAERFSLPGAPPLRLQRDCGGEEFKINCPFCHDTRKRCQINWRWGGQGKTRGQFTWLVQCFNEQCFSTASSVDEQDAERARWNRERLYEMVCVDTPPGRAPDMRRVHVAPSRRRSSKPELPGRCVPLVSLSLDHPANRYLRQRGFRPRALAKRYGLQLCLESKYPLATDRIIIPMHHAGALVGWQSRFIGQPPRNPINGARGLKAWTMPGFKRSHYGWGLSELKDAKLAVIVEGPFDRMRVGRNCVALLGKSISQVLLEKLAETVDPECLFFLMLDPDEDPARATSDRARGIVRDEPHHIEKAGKLFADAFGDDRVTKILLPAGSDPGSTGRKTLWNRISREAKRMGWTLPAVKA